VNKELYYNLALQWTRNTGKGTLNYTSYERCFTILVDGKPEIEGSSDPDYRGDKNKYNPEELLLASISSCHMLWFLHLCAVNNIIVTEYRDFPTGALSVTENGGGKFKEVNLNPVVTISALENQDLLEKLHKEANKLCFIANSLNFPVTHTPTFRTELPK
jgi:organic hydroperoxide reductase OsmC/OhrA